MSKDGAELYDPRELDYLYNEVDKIYGRFAQRCGLSPCAYWMMYEVVYRGGSATLREMMCSWSYSKQTINSALKVLVAKELVELDFEPGSKKNKMARLTRTGHAFAETYIAPAIAAEERAFRQLDEACQRELIESTRAYSHALARELGALEQPMEGNSAV